MLDLEKKSEMNSVLILNKPQVLTLNNFYIKLFKVPEIFSRLRQYRELLSHNNINIPIWVYCLTQDITTLRGTPQIEVVNFLISMGLYDRYISKIGWPSYIVGSGSLISVILEENTFKSEILDLTRGQHPRHQTLSCVKVQSYYNKRMKKFYLSGLKLKMESSSFKNIFEGLDQSLESDEEMVSKLYRFLCPHEDDLLSYLKSSEIFPRDFLEYDEDLRWLWPFWKRTQLDKCQTEKLA